MTIIVEDGSARDDAESYATIAQADKYHADRGASDWGTLTTEQKEQALRRATDFMLARYRTGWKGRRMNSTQTLDWPRYGVVIDGWPLPHNHTPREVVRACAELALKAAAGPLAEDATQKVIQETVGPITTRYDPNSPNFVRYTAVDMLLRPLLSAGSNSSVVQLVRV